MPCRLRVIWLPILTRHGRVPRSPSSGGTFLARHRLGPDDTLLFTCLADRAIWRLLVDRNALREAVVPLAVDDTIFHPGTADERVATRLRYQLAADAPLLLYVGRLNVQKNLHTL